MSSSHATDHRRGDPSHDRGVPEATAGRTAADGATALRRLHLARFGFALVWAVLLFVVAPGAGTISPLVAVLLVLYPLVDVAAAVVDLRASRRAGSTTLGAVGLSVNAALSASAAVGLVVALGWGLPAVLRVWGVWAVVAGLAQLVVALRRRGLGGRWAMVASGSISVLAGVSFVVMASGAGASTGGVAGYALLGGVFFLLSALRLTRPAG